MLKQAFLQVDACQTLIVIIHLNFKLTISPLYSPISCTESQKPIAYSIEAFK